MLNVAKAIANYLYREFDRWVEPEELLAKQSPIGIAYTIDEDENEIRVDVDLRDLSLATYIGNEMVQLIQYATPKEMQDEFELCSFDDFVRI